MMPYGTVRVIIIFNIFSAPVDSFFTMAAASSPQISSLEAKTAVQMDELKQQLQSTQQLLELRERQLAEATAAHVDSEQLKQQMLSAQQLLELKERQLAEATAMVADIEGLKQQLQSAQQLVELREGELISATSRLEVSEQLKLQLDVEICTKDGELSSLRQQLEQLNSTAVNAAYHPETSLSTTSGLFDQPSAPTSDKLSTPSAELPTAAQLFATGPSSNQLADLFAPAVAEPSAADPFVAIAATKATGREESELIAQTPSMHFDPTAAVESFAPSTGGTMPGEGDDQALPTPQSVEEYQAWYQQELETYQQAIRDWQAWGEDKSGEVAQLQANLADLGEALARATEEIEALKSAAAARSSSAERGGGVDGEETPAAGGAGGGGGHHATSGHDRVNEMLKLMRIKDLELEELRETIDRLETEKADLGGEVAEALQQVAELEAARDQVEAHRATSQLLEETKMAFERLKDEEHRLRWAVNCT